MHQTPVDIGVGAGYGQYFNSDVYILMLIVHILLTDGCLNNTDMICFECRTMREYEGI